VTGATTRVFIRRLSGVAVFDPNGDQVGRVRDVVVTLRSAPKHPRVIGVVVEVAPRRRIFVPMTRVTAIEPGEVVVSGTVNLKRFEQRPGEALVLSELIDSRVVRHESGESVEAIDVAMEQRRTGDWEIAKVFVQRRGRALRRRGEQFIVDASDVTGFSVDQQGQSTEALLATMETLRAADLAQALTELTPKRRAEVVAALDDERLADALEEMTEEASVAILVRLDQERAADVLEAMDPDDAADVLGELPEDAQAQLLDLMEPDDADDVRRLLSYDDYTAGGMMTTEPVILGPDASVAEALARVRNSDLAPSLAAQVYVCRPPLETPTGRYLGTVHFQRLLRETPSSLVSEVVDTELEPVPPEASLQQVTNVLATYNLVALPVVDDNDRLLGVITVDDVIDHMLPDDWRSHDFEQGASQVAPDGA
jgi:CBS domain-containing protein/sporulation protein YlmC with PRC-barrel domain